MKSLILQLGDNLLHDEGAFAVADLVRSLTDVQRLELWLGHNHISYSGVCALLDAIDTLPQVSHLALEFAKNDISKNGGLRIAETLRKMPALRFLTLELVRTNIGADGTAEIAKAIELLQRLEDLSLWFGQYQSSQSMLQHLKGFASRLLSMDPTGAISIARAAAALPRLATLRLDVAGVCDLSAVDMCSMATALLPAASRKNGLQNMRFTGCGKYFSGNGQSQIRAQLLEIEDTMSPVSTWPYGL